MSARPPRRSPRPDRPPGAPPRLDRRLAQHHLVAGALCRPLVAFLRPEGARVVEVGAGGGVLTGELLAAGAAAVWAWELDPGWASVLRRRLADPRLRVIAGDALELPWARLARPAGAVAAAGPAGGWLAAGNLPYNVGTAVLERFLTAAGPGEPGGAGFARGAFLVQKEVAERLAARPGDAAYGSLSVLVAAYAEARLLGRLPPGAFRPPPKVDSAFVGFTLRPPPLPRAGMPAFLATVRAAFGQRRKTLRNALGAAWGREAAAAALEAAEFAPKARAEELGLPELLRLHAAREGSTRPVV